jgi:hypothetical protein
MLEVGLMFEFGANDGGGDRVRVGVVSEMGQVLEVGCWYWGL